MRLITLLFLFSIPCVFSQTEAKPNCSLYDDMVPLCYHKRENPILNVSLLYYGDSMELEHLDRIGELLEERFNKATQRKMEVNIQHTATLAFKRELPEDFTFNNITDKKRLHRIWYYETVNVNILKEVYEVYREKFPDHTKKADVLLVITGAQFEALGYAHGRVSVTEYPQEIAWALPDQGRTNYPSDYVIVDELIHELGHNMFIGHAATPCSKLELTPQERKECIKNSPNANDVMSHHRNRSAVNEDYMHSFESCNMKMIEDSIIPNIIKGKKWRFSNRLRCD